jgi:hypothetical protein
MQYACTYVPIPEITILGYSNPQTGIMIEFPLKFHIQLQMSSLESIHSPILRSVWAYRRVSWVQYSGLHELNGHPPEFNIQHSGTLIGHPPEFNIQLWWAYWTPSGVQYSTLVSSLDTLQSSTFNYSEFIGHPLEFNIQLWWAYWTPSGVQYSTVVSPLDTLHISILNYSELIRHPPEFNIQLQWAHWTPSTLQYSTPVSLLDALRSSIFNSSEPIRHPPDFNIKLQWAY